MVRVLAPPLEGVSPLEVHPLRRERETPNVDPEVGMIPNRYEVDPDIRKVFHCLLIFFRLFIFFRHLPLLQDPPTLSCECFHMGLCALPA